MLAAALDGGSAIWLPGSASISVEAGDIQAIWHGEAFLWLRITAVGRSGGDGPQIHSSQALNYPFTEAPGLPARFLMHTPGPGKGFYVAN